MAFGLLALTAQEYGEPGGGAGIFGGVLGIVWLAVFILVIAGVWKVYSKAGQPGWASIVPIYNLVVLLKIVARPLWWLILLLIPAVNVIVAIIVSIDLAKRFGKGTGYGLGLAFLPFIFYPMLGFGSASYRG